MTLPKMMPMPTPAPTAPRPPPTPSAIALPASDPASAWAKIETSRESTGSPLSSVVLGDRAAEVDRRERGEDERLQGGHEADLEEEQDHAEREREHAEELEPQQDGEPAGHEEDDQVAGEDVGEQSHGERYEPHEVREELEDEDEAGHEARDPRRDEALEVADDALVADALDVVGDEDDQREHERHGHVGG